MRRDEPSAPWLRSISSKKQMKRSIAGLVGFRNDEWNVLEKITLARERPPQPVNFHEKYMADMGFGV